MQFVNTLSLPNEKTPITFVTALRRSCNNQHSIKPDSTQEEQLLTDIYDLLYENSHKIGKRWRKVPEVARKYLGAKTRRNHIGDPSHTERAAIMTALFLNGYAKEEDVELVMNIRHSGDNFWAFMELALENGFEETAKILDA